MRKRLELAMDNILRLKKSYRNWGVVGLIFFLSMMVVSFFGVLSEGHIFVALVFSGFWLGLAIVYAMILLAYYREFLSIQEGIIIQKRLFHQREVIFADMVSVCWQTFPAGGSVVLCSSTNKIKINFENFELEQRHPLIQSLRLSLPQSIQQDWGRFCQRIALPLLKHDPDAPLQDDEILLTRRRWDRFFLVTALLLMIVGIICAWLLHNLTLLVLPLAPLVMWPLMRFSTPYKGMRSKGMRYLNATPPIKKYFLFLFIWLIVAMATIVPIANSHPGLSMGLSAIWFAVLLYQSYRLDRRQEADRSAMVATAVEEWERLMATDSKTTEK